VRVNVEVQERWPCLSLDLEGTGWFRDGEDAVELPDALVEAWRRANAAQLEAEHAIIAWVKEHAPDRLPAELESHA